MGAFGYSPDATPRWRPGTRLQRLNPLLQGARAVRRHVGHFDTPQRARRNQLHRDRLRYIRGFIPDEVGMSAAFINKRHSRGVNLGRTRRVVTLVVRNRSCRNDDQAMPGVRVPARRPSCQPGIALHIQV